MAAKRKRRTDKERMDFMQANQYVFWHLANPKFGENLNLRKSVDAAINAAMSKRGR